MKYAHCRFGKSGTAYTYLLHSDLNAKEGDIAVVENDNTYGGSFGFALVRILSIVEVDAALIPPYAGAMKAIVDVIDTTKMQQRQDEAARFKLLADRAQRIIKRNKMLHDLEEAAGDSQEAKDVINELKELAAKMGVL